MGAEKRGREEAMLPYLEECRMVEKGSLSKERDNSMFVARRTIQQKRQ